MAMVTKIVANFWLIQWVTAGMITLVPNLYRLSVKRRVTITFHPQVPTHQNQLVLKVGYHFWKNVFTTAIVSENQVQLKAINEFFSNSLLLTQANLNRYVIMSHVSPTQYDIFGRLAGLEFNLLILKVLKSKVGSNYKRI